MKREGYPKTLKGKRDRLRAEAVERQTAWASLSFKQQLSELDKRSGQSKKQRARIAKLMQEQAVK